MLYPVTIISARYGGCYETKPWLAFNAYTDHYTIDLATADDITCATFFDSTDAEKVGRGHTPDEALADLERRINV